jgi:sodium-dependent dicarboxylate transporter 2/3/5
MAAWWLTGALPLAATAFTTGRPPLMGQGDIDEVAAHYADQVIFLFLSGFSSGRHTQWGPSPLRPRHHRAVDHPPRLVLAFMLATGIISMDLQSATAMMLPIAIAVADSSAGSSQRITGRSVAR